MNDAIEEAAKALAAEAPDLTVGAGPLLEAWVALELGAQLKAKKLVVRVATKLADGTVEYDQSYYVRTSQRTAFKADGTSWLEISVQSRTYEIHNSIRLVGRSGATHEADVCLAKRRMKSLRLKPSAVIECKNYTAGPMPCNAVRALVAVRADTPSALHSLWSVLCTTTRTRNSRLIARHFGILAFGDLVPSRNNVTIARLIQYLPPL